MGHLHIVTYMLVKMLAVVSFLWLYIYSNLVLEWSTYFRFAINPGHCNANNKYALEIFCRCLKCHL